MESKAKYTNISFKCISCVIVPQSGNGLWVSNCNGWQTSHICRRATVENVEKFINKVSFHNLSTPVPVSNRIFCFVLHFSFSLHQNKSIGILTIFRFADLANDTGKTFSSNYPKLKIVSHVTFSFILNNFFTVLFTLWRISRYRQQ